MKSGFKQFKLEEWIRSDDDLVALLNDALASANQKFLLVVLGAAAKRQGLDAVAQRAHLERPATPPGNSFGRCAKPSTLSCKPRSSTQPNTASTGL